MIAFNTYINFFKNLAQKHVDILDSTANKRFFRLNINEITGDMRSVINTDTSIMVLESYEHTSKDNHSENYLSEFTGAFMILKKVALDDYDAQDVAITECEKTALEISKRIYNDSITNYATHFFTDVELNSFTFQKIGPLYNSWYGFRCQFNFAGTYPIGVDNTKWTDLP